ncbi:MAG: enoyl-CoA hydratase-related protein [Deferrisomatales bacterium]|nr:enoyl-CoA hydratase-related protein [Deferrisomatales bacterium]
MSARRAHYELEDRVAVVTLDNPPLNALNVDTREALAAVFAELHGRRNEIRAVVLRGGGDKAFAAGADIKGFLDLDCASARRQLLRAQEINVAVESFPRPVLAAIHGYCLGGGLELALCCDCRFASEDAKFGFPEVKLSVFPGNGGTQRARRHLSLGRVKELMFTGDMVGAREALEYGLVERVVPAGQVLEATLAVAGRIASRGPLAVAAVKAVLNATQGVPLAEGLEVEADAWSRLAETEDMKEGARAFLEKREPLWKAK